MAVESKIIVTAEDRSAAAFAAIERNTGKTTMAMLKLQGQMLKLAGAGSLVAFFKSGADSTEKWQDEMARLGQITEKFFNTAADSGRLDPFIKAVKAAYTLAFGASVAIENMGLAIGSLAAAATATVKLEFAEARRIMQLSSQDMTENEERFRKLKEDIFKEAPSGFAKGADKKLSDDFTRTLESMQMRTALLGKETQEEQILFEVQKGRFSFLDQASKDALIAAARQFDATKQLVDLEKENNKRGEERLQEEMRIRAQINEMVIREEEKAAEKEKAEKDRLQKKVESIQESFLTEKMLEEVQYDEKKQILMDRRTEELFGQQEQARLLEELELQHQAKMGNVEAQGILARRRFEEMNAKQKTQFVLSEMLALTEGVANSNKTMFKLNKALALANLAVAMPDAIGLAIERGGGLPWGAAFGILTAAKYVMLMQQAKNADFGTSTSPPSIGGGGATPVFNAESVLPDLSQQANAVQRKTEVTIKFEGPPPSAEWIRDQLGPAIKEAVGDGAFNVAMA